MHTFKSETWKLNGEREFASVTFVMQRQCKVMEREFASVTFCMQRQYKAEKLSNI